ncbi:MAG: hypothetical protein RR555_08185 [Bacteroidales bacterium]
MKFFSLTLMALSFVACKNERATSFFMPSKEHKSICITSVKVNKISLDSTIQTSLTGNVGLRNNGIYFMDYLFSTYYQFDTLGNFQEQALGHGRGPKETTLGLIVGHVFTEDDQLVLIGPTDDIHIHDSNFSRLPGYRVQRKPYQEGQKMEYDQFETYSFGYPLICRTHGKSVYTNNSAEFESFNYFETPDIFVEQFRCLTEQCIFEKRTGRLLGKGMPEMFKGTSDKNYIFSTVLYDIDKFGCFYVTFMADPHIYKFDEDFNLISSFGLEGNQMDKEYLSIKDPKQVRVEGIAQYSTKGYYTYLEYIEELGYLLRSYQRGGDALFDGLQIYQNDVLIGDVDVPKGFKPMGYMKPYIYSHVISDKEKLSLYKIKIQ